MILSQGFAARLPKAPEITSSFLNGQSGPEYRPVHANHLPYSQQRNLTVEHQFTSNLYISGVYSASELPANPIKRRSF